MPSAALAPHPATPCAALRGIGVSIRREPARLMVEYVLEGQIDLLRIPAARPPRAAERLWQHTCCELFVARAHEPGYREFNFSPSGEWAAYAFAAYRDGAPMHIDAPGIRVEREPERLMLSASVPAEDQTLKIGACVVVEDARGVISYWALRHAPGKPDFHHPAAFAMALDAIRH
jgi:hypothetical protein